MSVTVYYYDTTTNLYSGWGESYTLPEEAGCTGEAPPSLNGRYEWDGSRWLSPVTDSDGHYERDSDGNIVYE